MKRPLLFYLHPSLRDPVRRVISRVTSPLVRVLFLTRPARTTMHGLRMTVPPGVFHPKLFFSTGIFMRHIASLPLSGRSVLDMGTGSGAIGLTAARLGARVTGLDINPDAVACAGFNAHANGLASHFTAMESDLFEALQAGTQFDCILWNPPYYPGEPGDHAGAAWYAGEQYRTIERFALHAGRFLRTGGSVHLVLSSDADLPFITRIFLRAGFSPPHCRIVHSLLESFLILEFALSDGTGG